MPPVMTDDSDGAKSKSLIVGSPHHDMKHPNTQHLEERLAALEDIQKSTAGAHAPKVCRVCYSVQDVYYTDDCLCKRASWTLLEAVIATLHLQIDDSQEQRRDNFINREGSAA